MYKVIYILKSLLIFIFMFEPSEQEDVTDSKLALDQSVTLQFDFHFESLNSEKYFVPL